MVSKITTIEFSQGSSCPLHKVLLTVALFLECGHHLGLVVRSVLFCRLWGGSGYDVQVESN